MISAGREEQKENISDSLSSEEEEGRGMEKSLQDLDGRDAPLSTDLSAVGQVAQVAEHATVIAAALLACFEALVAGMRTDVRKDALEYGRGQASELKGGLSRRREPGKLTSSGWTELGRDFELDAALFVLFAERQSHDGRMCRRRRSRR
jgi:hypothetical protein